MSRDEEGIIVPQSLPQNQAHVGVNVSKDTGLELKGQLEREKGPATIAAEGGVNQKRGWFAGLFVGWKW